jgi:hypothetical protein
LALSVICYSNWVDDAGMGARWERGADGHSYCSGRPGDLAFVHAPDRVSPLWVRMARHAAKKEGVPAIVIARAPIGNGCLRRIGTPATEIPNPPAAIPTGSSGK